MAYVYSTDTITSSSTVRYIASSTLEIYYDPTTSSLQSTGRTIASGEYVDVYNYTCNGYMLLTTLYGWVSTSNLAAIATSTSYNGTSITSTSQMVKVSVEVAYIYPIPSTSVSSTGSLSKGDTFTATGKITVNGETWYRKSDTEWVYSYYLTKTSTADLNSEANSVTKPSAVSGAEKLSSCKSILCSLTQNLRRYPSDDELESNTIDGSYVRSGSIYSVTYKYETSSDCWYYLADGSGWFCGKLDDNDISSDLGESTEDGKSTKSYIVTVDSLNFRSTHDGSSSSNIYGKFYKGDCVALVDDQVYTKTVNDANGTATVLEKWIHVYGKNNSGTTVAGWICIEYNTPSTNSDGSYVYNSDGTISMSSTSTYASNDIATINTPSNLYQVTSTTTAYDSNGNAVGTYTLGSDVTLTGTTKTVNGVTYALTSDNTWVVTSGLTQYTQEMYIAKLVSEQNTAAASSLVATAEEEVSLSDFETALDQLRVKDLYGLWGAPYQYSRITDCRIDDDNYKFGRLYAEKIMGDLPMLLIMPGVPTFMGDEASSTRKEGLIATLTSMASTETLIDDFLDKETRFYTLTEAYTDYFNYVNPMCRAGAFFLDIADQTIAFGNENKPLKNFDWKDIYTQGMWAQVFDGTINCIAFYVNSETSVSDTWSNSTSELSVASQMNTISDQAREINYLIGNINAKAGGTFDSVLEGLGLGDEVNITGLQETISELVNGSFLKNTSFGNIISSASHTVSGLIQGSKMIFPELWSESSYGTEYTVNMKLVTPDGDKLSWYLNIWVPLCHLIALVAPRTLTSMNMYHSPFIVSANYKSMFNCPMGIITSLSITKGAEQCWTLDGLPTIVEVSMTIKDLYTSFAITSSLASSEDLGVTSGFFGNLFTNAFMNNTKLMDYIANSCGVNINEPDLERDFEMWVAFQFENKIVDTIDNKISSIKQWIGTKVLKILNGVFK